MNVTTKRAHSASRNNKQTGRRWTTQTQSSSRAQLKFGSSGRAIVGLTRDDKEPDIFLHVSSLPSDYDFEPRRGDRVSFTVGTDRRGRPEAARRLSWATAPRPRTARRRRRQQQRLTTSCSEKSHDRKGATASTGLTHLAAWPGWRSSTAAQRAARALQVWARIGGSLALLFAAPDASTQP